MKQEAIPALHYRGQEIVIVEKCPAEYGPGSVLCVDANQDGEFEYESVVGADGIVCLAFPFAPKVEGEWSPSGRISRFYRSAEGDHQSKPISTLAIQKSPDNLAKAIPENCAVETPAHQRSGMEYVVEPEICVCISCSNNDTLSGASLEGFTNSFTPVEEGIETTTGKYRTVYPITSFDTRLLGFEMNLHHSTLVKYDGPFGQSTSHSLNMMIVQQDQHTGQIVTPDLRIFDIHSEDGINWQLPVGFYSRLRIDNELNRWILTHFSGLEVAFYRAVRGCPGYPVSVCEPNGNANCMTYDTSGYLQEITTDLGQIQKFDYDVHGRHQTFTDHIGRCWQFCHDKVGRLVEINTPATAFANIRAAGEVLGETLDTVVVDQPRCWRFKYDDHDFPNQVTAEIDPRGATYRRNTFDQFGRTVVATINQADIVYSYDLPNLPLEIPGLESGNLLRSITDRGGNITFHEIHGAAGGPKNGLGRYGLRRAITLTESGKGNPPLRADEPAYWERRWLHDCDCLVQISESQWFSADQLPTLEFDHYGIPCNYPREDFVFNAFRQKVVATYSDGTDAIIHRWSYQDRAFGDRHQFSRMLSHTDPRQDGDTQLYSGTCFVHRHCYDEQGNHVRHVSPIVTRGVETEQVISEKWVYNRFGQVVRHIDPNGNITNTSYFDGPSSGGDINTEGNFGGYLSSSTKGASGSRDRESNLTRRFRVNALGMATVSIDEKGFEYRTRYNDLQEAVALIRPVVTLINGQQVQYQTQTMYDGAGNAVLVRRNNIDVDGSIATNSWIDQSSRFDTVNNRLSVRVEVDENEANDLITRFAYDSNDDLAVTQKPEGNREFRVYDERRLEFKQFYGIAPSEECQSAGVIEDSIVADLPSSKTMLALETLPFVGLRIYDYDARQNLITITDGRGNTEHYFYDFYNRNAAYADQNGNGWEYQFDDDSNILTELRGSVCRSAGMVVEVLQRSYGRYDEAGRRYQSVRDIDLDSDQGQLVDPDDGKNSSYLSIYDAGSRVIRHVDAEQNQTVIQYDAANRPRTTTDALGNQQIQSYDANSNVTELRQVELPGPGAAGQREAYLLTFDFDELNRRTAIHDRGLNGNSIDHVMRFGYDSRDNWRLRQDPEGNTELITYDDLDRKMRLRRFDANPLLENSNTLQQYDWKYDRNSNTVEESVLSDVDDANTRQSHRYTFDSLDRIVEVRYPDGVEDSNAAGRDASAGDDQVAISYDPNSNPISIVNQRGITFASLFDPANRLTRNKTCSSFAVAGADRLEFAYDALNRMVGASNNFADVSHNFDALSRLTAESQSISLDGAGFEQGWRQPIRLTHQYDKQSNRTDYTVRDGTSADLTVSAGYDALNRTSGISASYFDRERIPVVDFRYIGPGRVQQKLLGNGVSLRRRFDVKRRVQSHLWRSDARLLAGFEYRYDRMDNALSERFLHDGGLFDHFEYNNRYELTGVTYRSASEAPTLPMQNSYRYDDVHTRVASVTADPLMAKPVNNDTYVTNRVNEIIRLNRNGDDFEVEYDGAGNAIRFLVDGAPNGVSSVTVGRWDAFNLLFDTVRQANGGVLNYRYDALRRRVAFFAEDAGVMAADSRRYIYDGWSVVEERLFEPGKPAKSVESSLERIYVNGRKLDEPLLTAIVGDERPQTPAVEYYLLDNRMSSTMALSDAADPDNILEYYRYSAFGRPVVLLPMCLAETGTQSDTTASLIGDATIAQSQFKNVYFFTARRYDFVSGLYYYRNRYYEAASGRFLSRDTVRNMVSWANRYDYVENNPCNWQDPLGLTRQKADCVECRLIVNYAGFLGTGGVAKSYEKSPDNSIPSVIDRGWWIFSEKTIRHVYLQARVTSSEKPCCCKANARSTVSYTSALPDLSDYTIDLSNGIKEALKEYDPTADPSLTDEILGKLTSQLTASKAIHKLGLESIIFAIKRTQHKKMANKPLTCEWQVMTGYTETGGIPTAESVTGEVKINGTSACKIEGKFDIYEPPVKL